MYKTKSIIILIGIILICTISCTPEKRLARLVKKHPELVQKDTIWNDTTIYIQSKNLSGYIKIQTNFDSLLNVYDSLVNSYHKKDTSGVIKINEIRKYIVNYKILNDTIIDDSLGVVFKIWQQGKYLRYSIKINEDSLKLKYATQANSVNPINEVNVLKWYHYLTCFLVFLLFVLIIYLLK